MKIQPFSRIFSLLLAVMALLAWLGYQLVSQAPMVKVLESLRLSPPTNPDQTLVLGWEALGQDPHAGLVEKQHLQARFIPNEGWWLANVAVHRKIEVMDSENQWFELRRIALQSGDVIQLGKQALTVRAVSPHLLLDVPSPDAPTHPISVTWDGNTFQAGKPNYVGCPKAWQQSPYLPAYFRDYLSEKTAFLGGAVQCHDRLALPDVPYRTASLIQSQGVYYLHPLQGDIPVSLVRDGKTLLAAQFETAAADVSLVIIGKTAYALEQQGECKTNGCDLLLSAKTDSTRPVFAVDAVEPTLPTHLMARWSSPHWVGDLGSVESPSPTQWLILCGLLLVIGWLMWALPIWRADLLGKQNRAEVQLLLGTVALAFWLGAVWLEGRLAWQLGLAWLSWGTASYVLHRNGLLQGTLGQFWLALVLLAGVGALTQVQLAVGADNTRYLRFPTTHLQFLLVVPLLVCVVGLTPISLLQRAWGGMQQTRLRWWLLGILLAILFGQAFMGDETGLGAVQPVEFAKTVLVLLLAGFVLNWP